MLMPSATPGVDQDVADVCLIPLAWGPYFIEGDTPKGTLDKVELLVASIPIADREPFQIIRTWARYACVATGQAPPGSNQPSVAVAWRDFPRFPPRPPMDPVGREAVQECI
jgi:hypothetical protein